MDPGFMVDETWEFQRSRSSKTKEPNRSRKKNRRNTYTHRPRLSRPQFNGTAPEPRSPLSEPPAGISSPSQPSCSIILSGVVLFVLLIFTFSMDKIEIRVITKDAPRSADLVTIHQEEGLSRRGEVDSRTDAYIAGRKGNVSRSKPIFVAETTRLKSNNNEAADASSSSEERLPFRTADNLAQIMPKDELVATSSVPVQQGEGKETGSPPTAMTAMLSSELPQPVTSQLQSQYSVMSNKDVLSVPEAEPLTLNSSPESRPNLGSTDGISTMVEINAASVEEEDSNTLLSTSKEDSKRPLPSMEEQGFQRDPQIWSDTYQPRGKQVDQATKERLAAQWGSWTLVDTEAFGIDRPAEDFYAAYLNRDVPRNQFPDTAWQFNAEYMGNFLPEAIALVERSMEAILTEYGHGKFDMPGQPSMAERDALFRLEISNDNVHHNNLAGWTNQKSFDGLVRRILHALMTEDTFTLVTIGHAAAAGHGNHFQQSYTMQFQKVMEPVFARLGVVCQARNMAHGGLGTVQDGLAAGTMYGPDVDMLVWDAGTTEHESRIQDVVLRQAIMGGERVPLIWATGGMNVALLQELHDRADADVGTFGSQYDTIPVTENSTQVEMLPWAARYLRCQEEQEMQYTCLDHAYAGTCWIDREDYTPTQSQRDVPPGRARWHPGYRWHQLRGRALAYTVLRGLRQALEIWLNAVEHALPDEAWHVSGYYKNIQSKVKRLPRDLLVGSGADDCYNNTLPDRICNVPLKAYSEFTPRYHPAETSIRNIMVQQQENAVPLLQAARNVYEPPDVWNPYLDVPDGIFDYLAVVENGNDFGKLRARENRFGVMAMASLSSGRQLDAFGMTNTSNNNDKSSSTDIGITPGTGFSLWSKAGADLCDGTYDSFCGRGAEDECLLYGHNDYRGGIELDGYSGWMILNLPVVKFGLIMVMMDDGLADSNPATSDWKCENNLHCDEEEERASSRRRLDDQSGANSLRATTQRRRVLTNLSSDAASPNYCDNFQFHYALNGGAIQTLNKTAFLQAMKPVQRMVQIWTLLDDENFTAGKAIPLQLALKVTGCGREKVFRFSHVYYA